MRSLKFSTKKAGDSGELAVWFQSKSEGLRNERADGICSSSSPSLKVGEQCSSSKVDRQSKFSLPQPVFSAQIISELNVVSIHIGEGQSPLLSLLIQTLISSTHILTDTLRIMFSPNIWVPSDSFKLIQKIGHPFHHFEANIYL